MKRFLAVIMLIIFNLSLKSQDKVNRIVAIGPGALRIVAYLDAIDKVVGVENIEIKYPKSRPYSVSYYDKIKNLPIISEGGPDKLPDFERIIKLKPDLIFIGSSDEAVINTITEKTGIKVFSVDYGGIGGFDLNKFRKVILNTSKILGKEKRGDYLLKKIDYYLSDIKKRVKDLKFDKKVYIGGIGFKGAHGIESTLSSYQPFDFLGIKNSISSDLPHIFTTKEKILSINPDYIFIDKGGLSLISEDIIKNMDYYKMLKAFKEGKVYVTLPYNHYTTNVEIVFVNTYFVGKVLFKEKFKDVDLMKKCGEIFKDFVGKDVCSNFMDDNNFYKRVEILSGKPEFRDI